MKQKTLIILLCISSIVNSGLLFMFWKQQKTNVANIGYLETKIDRLDIDALERIKSQEDNKIDCSNLSSGDWLSSDLCS